MLKLSASSIGTYEKCPKNYHYRYIEKPDIEKKEWVHLELGSCAHRVLELFHIEYSNSNISSDEIPGLMKTCYKQGLSEFNRDLLRPELPLLKKMIQGYLNKLSKEGIPNVVGVESSFLIQVGDYKVRGFIDRIDKVGDGEYHVVDYKTSKNPKYLTDFQLRVYSLALKELYPDAEVIHGSYCLLKHDSKLKSWTFSQYDLDECAKKIKNTGDLIETDNLWIKKPTFLCRWCDYQEICQNNWTDQ